eukprot:scaffold294081_cov36-Tisochrysis_lutea.AAC.2
MASLESCWEGIGAACASAHGATCRLARDGCSAGLRAARARRPTVRASITGGAGRFPNPLPFAAQYLKPKTRKKPAKNNLAWDGRGLMNPYEINY